MGIAFFGFHPYITVADTELPIKALTNPIYHYVKGFCHEHNSTSPSLLQGDFFRIPPSPFSQRELHRFPQAPFPSGDRGCNRPPVLRTATLYGWRGIKALRQVLRAGTALIKVDRIIEVLVLW